jgi:hypothetical protein
MNLKSFSKPKIAIVVAALYTAIMGIEMFYLKTFLGITYGQPEMMNLFWFILIILNGINVFWVTRYFSWQAIGFRALNRQQLLWFLPSIAVLIALRYYQHFDGKLWKQSGELTWMSPWKRVYAPLPGIQPNIVTNRTVEGKR